VGSSSRTSSPRLLGLALAVALLATAPVALAAAGEGEITRPEYVAKLEPICAANAKANSKILKGVKGQVNKGKLVPAGKRFVRAAGALGRSVGQMEKVPKPSADEAKLDKWFGYLKNEQSFLRLIGKALEAGDKYKASKLASNLNRNNNKANNTIISFGFKECRIESSRFV
jgi:hypothetical protein